MSTACPRCGAVLPPDAPEGLCPACLFAAGLGDTQPHTPEPPDRAQYLETLLNRRLPDYKLRHLIGRGGMGEVWLAEQPSLGRSVAIKVMSAAVSADPVFAERFHREAKAMAQLDHPHIVRIFDYGCIDELFFIVMEYLPSNLRQFNFCRNSDDSWHLPLRAFFDLCDAVAHAHSKGILRKRERPVCRPAEATPRLRRTNSSPLSACPTSSRPAEATLGSRRRIRRWVRRCTWPPNSAITRTRWITEPTSMRWA
jgi:hypothetical protein